MVTHYFIRRTLVFVPYTVLLLWFWIIRQPDTLKRYNDAFCPGNITIQTSQNDTFTGPVLQPDFSPSPYAYVFYATKAEYACSVLVNIDRLRNTFHTKHRIIVLVTPTVGSEYLSRFTAQNATVLPHQPPPLFDSNVTYYTDVLLKLIGFSLHHYIPSLDRVLILDSDQIILQSLDHVFSLPAVDLAAPRANWQGTFGFTSAFLLVSLSDRLWHKIEGALQTISHDTFDMDLLNAMFAETVMVLPGDYCTLNSQWEINELPNWWQGSAPPRDPLWKPSRKLRPTPDPPPIEVPSSLKIPLISKATQNLTEADQILLTQYRNATARREMKIQAAKDEVDEAHKRQIQKDELKERRKRFAKVLEDVYKHVKVMHYTALAKPWQKYVVEVKESRPDAHPLFAKGFELWRRKAAKICPWKEKEYIV